MGRTKRKRNRIKLKTNKSVNLDNDLVIINLRKWLSKNNWTNCANLQLRDFPETGRGVTSQQNTHENKILIQMPLDLMITYRTLHSSEIIRQILRNNQHAKFNIHELLALFLVIEKHNSEKSPWKHYINTLPCPAPTLPWFASTSELKLYPKDLQVMAVKNLSNFNESFLRVKKSITSLICDCCKKLLSCVITNDLFKWAYVVVNSRAVYVDPQVCGMNNYSKYLSDDPSMALCPFLDMFNHHHQANTDVKLISSCEQTYFQLSCLSRYQRFEQIFISYGAHDNFKLLMEYGFYIAGNEFDTLTFNYEEVLRLLDINLNERQYKFVKSHNFHKYEELFISCSGASFNLKAFLYVAFNPTAKDFNSVVFNDSYDMQFQLILKGCLRILLCHKMNEVANDLDKFKVVVNSESGMLLLDFLQYRVDFVKSLINVHDLT